MPRSRRVTGPVMALVLGALLLAGCQSPASDSDSRAGSQSDRPGAGSSGAGGTGSEPVRPPPGDGGELTLAFAGDVHFEGRLAGLPQRAASTLGPMTRHLNGADLAMVNLESALADSGRRTGKDLEDAARRYWFRTGRAALDLLDRSGVDVVSVANNHGADYGADGLADTLAIAEDAPVAVVGAGESAAEAFAPHRVRIGRSDVAVLAADAAPRESDDSIWAAGEGGRGIASARQDPPERLVAAVESANRTEDLVVVYLHWGRSGERCPTDQQRRLARTLTAAGADVVVGSHAHVLLGAGMLGEAHVGYGLGNFLWYHGGQQRSGVLKLRVSEGRVVGQEFVPARIPRGGGQPQPLQGDARAAARSQWQDLRGCTGLEPAPSGEAAPGGDESSGDQASGGAGLPAFEARTQRIGPSLRRRMAPSHDPQRCPVDLADLRHLTLSYVGFDGRAHTGELVVRARHVEDVVGVFEELYAARWPIRRMRLVDEYAADDNRSMAADNTSAYNCRRVAGQDTWSAHAYGAAIDINPVQNPYVTAGGVRPPDGRRFARVDRSPGVETGPGVIRRGDVVVRAFERVGWTWGGSFSEPDYQHFTAR